MVPPVKTQRAKEEHGERLPVEEWNQRHRDDLRKSIWWNPDYHKVYHSYVKQTVSKLLHKITEVHPRAIIRTPLPKTLTLIHITLIHSPTLTTTTSPPHNLPSISFPQSFPPPPLLLHL